MIFENKQCLDKKVANALIFFHFFKPSPEGDKTTCLGSNVQLAPVFGLNLLRVRSTTLLTTPWFVGFYLTCYMTNYSFCEISIMSEEQI